jgi:hypothetical protein
MPGIITHYATTRDKNRPAAAKRRLFRAPWHPAVFSRGYLRLDLGAK